MSEAMNAVKRERADVLRRLELAADQVAAWNDQRDQLVCKAFDLGVSQRKIAPYAQVNQATVSRLIARERAANGCSGSVDSGKSET